MDQLYGYFQFAVEHDGQHHSVAPVVVDAALPYNIIHVLSCCGAVIGLKDQP